MAFIFFLVSWGVMRLRRTRHDHDRPYRVPVGGLIPYLAAALSLVMFALSFKDPVQKLLDGEVAVEWIILIVWSGLGLGFWRLGRKMRDEISADDRRYLILSEHEGDAGNIEAG